MLPEDAERAINDRGAGTVLKAIRTAGRWPVGGFGPQQKLATLWVAITERRYWVVGAEGDDAFVEAGGSRDGITLDRGWVTDALLVGRHTLPLRTGGRRAAREVVELWAAQPGGGPEVLEMPERLPAIRGEVAEAPVGVPEWASAEVPCTEGAVWLFGLEMSATHAFGRADAAPSTSNVWLLVSDRDAIFVARNPDGGLARFVVPGALSISGAGARSYLECAGLAVAAPLMASEERDLAVALVRGDGVTRWATLAEHHAEQGGAEEAMKIWREALRRDLGDLCWPGIARFAWTVSDWQRAHTALAHALSTHRLEAGDRSAWAVPVERRERAIRRVHKAAADLSRILGSSLDALGAPPRSRELPSPPADEVELWVGALAALRRWSEADAAARALSSSPRSSEVVAVVRELQGAAGSDRAWLAAAEGWREATEHEAARRCLDRALSLGGGAAELWISGAWSWTDGLHGTARSRWEEALAKDPGAHHLPESDLDAEGWRTLAAMAEGDAALSVAVRAWRQVLQLEPTDLDAALAGARVMEAAGLPLADAAKLLAGAAQASEDADGAMLARVWCRVAELRAPGERFEALQAALACDALHGDVWEPVLGLCEGEGADLAAWWTHVASVVRGGPVAAPAITFEAPDDLGTLNEATTGWQERLQRMFDTDEAPARRALVRGLDRLEKLAPEADEAIRTLAGAMRIPRTPEGWIYGGEDAFGTAGWATAPPVILVGRDHLEPGPRQLDPAALRFLIAVELAHLACRHPLLKGSGGVLGTSQSVYSAFGRYAGTAEDILELLSLVPGIDQVAKIERIFRISRKVFAAQGTLDRASSLAAPLLRRVQGEEEHATAQLARSLEGARMQLVLHADRVALVFTRDLRAALHGMLASADLLELAPRLEAAGLATLLADPPAELGPALSLRLGSIASFAAVKLPELRAS